jgi:hypothetical protein
MNSDYTPLGWTETDYATSSNYNPHGLNNDKTDHMLKSSQTGARLNREGELDFGEAHIYDFRLAKNEVVYGD